MPFESVRGITFPTSEEVVQGVFVKLAELGRVENCEAGEDSVGVSLEATAVAADSVPYVAGDTISVAAIDGARVEMLSGAAIDVSSAVVLIMSDSTGRAVTATGTGVFPLGFAVSSVAGANEFVTVILSKQGNALL